MDSKAVHEQAVLERAQKATMIWATLSENLSHNWTGSSQQILL